MKAPLAHRRGGPELRGAVAMAVWLSLAFAAGGCFEPEEPACGFACGEEEACPENYRCAPDGWCKRDDVDDDHPCGELGDAGASDADAPDTAAPDAGEGASAGPRSGTTPSSTGRGDSQGEISR